MAETAQACMSMHDFNLLSNDNVSEDGEEGEDSWEGGGAVDDEEGDVVDLEAIREVSHSRSPLVCMRDDDDLVAPVDEFRGELVDVAFDSAWLWEEVIADHSNVVRHRGDWMRCSSATQQCGRRRRARVEGALVCGGRLAQLSRGEVVIWSLGDALEISQG
jgi:hypothetical protein